MSENDSLIPLAELVAWLEARAARMGDDFPHYRSALHYLAAAPEPPAPGVGWVLVPRERFEEFTDALDSLKDTAEANGDAYNVAYIGAMVKDADEWLATPPAPSAGVSEAMVERALHTWFEHGGEPLGVDWYEGSRDENARGMPKRMRAALNAALQARPAEAYPTASDRAVLLYLMQQFDSEQWVCRQCGHEETTADMDSADYLRRYLASAPFTPPPASISAEARDAVTVDRVASLIVLDVAELPDRNSPEDWPEAMLVTHDELHAIAVRNIAAALSAQLAGDGERGA